MSNSTKFKISCAIIFILAILYDFSKHNSKSNSNTNINTNSSNINHNSIKKSTKNYGSRRTSASRKKQLEQLEQIKKLREEGVQYNNINIFKPVPSNYNYSTKPYNRTYQDLLDEIDDLERKIKNN